MRRDEFDRQGDIDHSRVDGLTRHSVDQRGRFVLRYDVAGPRPHLPEAGNTVTTHACQDDAYQPCAVSARGRFKEHARGRTESVHRVRTDRDCLPSGAYPKVNVVSSDVDGTGLELFATGSDPDAERAFAVEPLGEALQEPSRD